MNKAVLPIVLSALVFSACGNKTEKEPVAAVPPPATLAGNVPVAAQQPMPPAMQGAAPQPAAYPPASMPPQPAAVPPAPVAARPAASPPAETGCNTLSLIHI